MLPPPQKKTLEPGDILLLFPRILFLKPYISLQRQTFVIVSSAKQVVNTFL